MTKQEKIKLAEDSIAHYIRMIAWVEMQTPYVPPNEDKMREEISEAWYHDNCVYCKVSRGGCTTCSVQKSCAMYWYAGVEIAQTWDEWLQGARAIVAELERIKQDLIRKIEREKEGRRQRKMKKKEKRNA